MRCVFLTDLIFIDDKNLARFEGKHVRVLVRMSNRTGALRMLCQTLQTWNHFTLLGPCY